MKKQQQEVLPALRAMLWFYVDGALIAYMGPSQAQPNGMWSISPDTVSNTPGFEQFRFAHLPKMRAVRKYLKRALNQLDAQGIDTTRRLAASGRLPESPRKIVKFEKPEQPTRRRR